MRHIPLLFLFKWIACWGQAATVELQPEPLRNFLSQPSHVRKRLMNDRTFRRKNHDADFSRPLPFLLRWQKELPEGAKLLLALSEDFSQAEAIPVQGTECALRNLLPGHQYHWRLLPPGGQTPAASGDFQTAGALPRLCAVDGIANVRDCGGYPVAGGRLRFGMLFRGEALDERSGDGFLAGTQRITEGGVRTMRETLRIRTEIDLRAVPERGRGTTTSRLGAGVLYCPIPAGAYGGIREEASREAFRKIVSVLARRESYPVYFHCQEGTDRTGTLAFLLGAFLGVAEESLECDWQISLFANRAFYFKPLLFQLLRNALAEFGAPDDTLARKAECYFLACGISPDELSRLRDILRESK